MKENGHAIYFGLWFIALNSFLLPIFWRYCFLCLLYEESMVHVFGPLGSDLPSYLWVIPWFDIQKKESSPPESVRYCPPQVRRYAYFQKTSLFRRPGRPYHFGLELVWELPSRFKKEKENKKKKRILLLLLTQETKLKVKTVSQLWTLLHFFCCHPDQSYTITFVKTRLKEIKNTWYTYSCLYHPRTVILEHLISMYLSSKQTMRWQSHHTVI